MGAGAAMSADSVGMNVESMPAVCGSIIRPSPAARPNFVASMPIAIFLPRADPAGHDVDTATGIEALRQVVFHEIRKGAATPLTSVPRPRHAGLLRLTSMQLGDLAVEWPLPACAKVAHMSVRTFCRVFPQEA